jgi:uncharacterized protein (DUF1800 family)
MLIGMVLDSERAKVAHLLRRAGFGTSEAELDEYTALGFNGSLDRLLHPEQVDDSVAEATLAPLALDPTNPEARRQIEPAKFWWFNRMLLTKRPLQEKMTLFWHTHFATANSKVGDALLMVQQNQLFRDNAMGNFETLLQQVTRDPATLIWLDNRTNRKGAPNENYAREVMELFTVGIGNYSDEDVKQAARAFTGYTLNADKQFVFQPNQHDAGDKTFLGETKNWDADDILARLVRHPATARYLTTKLFRFFVNDYPAPATIDRLANTYTQSGFDMRSVLRDLFTGPEFLSAETYHAQIKQPVDYMIGSLKALGTQSVGPDVTQVLRRMGQDLLNPPDVSGWKVGSYWINSTTLFERFNFANRLVTSRDSSKPYFTDVGAQIEAHGLSDPGQLLDYYLALLVDRDASADARAALADYLQDGSALTLDAKGIDLKARGLVHLAMSLPSFQLG